MTYELHPGYSPTYHSRAAECLQKIRGTDYVVFFLFNFHTLVLKSIPMNHSQISNEILCPYCRRYRDCNNPG